MTKERKNKVIYLIRGKNGSSVVENMMLQALGPKRKPPIKPYTTVLTNLLKYNDITL